MEDVPVCVFVRLISSCNPNSHVELLVTQNYISNSSVEALGDPDLQGHRTVANGQEDWVEIDGIRFFRTGDIGQINKDGSLSIIDRKKDGLGGQQIQADGVNVNTKFPFLVISKNYCTNPRQTKQWLHRIESSMLGFASVRAGQNWWFSKSMF